MNEVDAELRGVFAESVDDVAPHLIFFLLPLNRKSRNRSNELVIAEGFESGDGLRCRAEREGKRESKVRIARLVRTQSAGVEREGTQPARAEYEPLAGVPDTAIAGPIPGP